MDFRSRYVPLGAQEVSMVTEMQSNISDSRSYAFQALEKGWNIVPRIIGKSRDAMLFQQMVEAANLAGRAINISKTTASHAWSYAFTTHHNIPHGHAVWLTLPAIFQAHLNASDDEIIDTRGVKYFRRLMQKIAELIDPEILSCPEKILKDFLVTIGIEHEFNELGLTSQDQRKFISSQVNIERMANHPVNLLRHTNKIFNIL